MNPKRFTALEIVTLVAIIVLLVIITTPTFIKARQSTRTHICIDNLTRIGSAKGKWAAENRASKGDPVAASWRFYLKDARIPKCPAGGEYTIGPVRTNPTCSLTGHRIK